MPFQLSLEKVTNNFMKTCLNILVLFKKYICLKNAHIDEWLAEIEQNFLKCSGEKNRKTTKKWDCFFLATYWL